MRVIKAGILGLVTAIALIACASKYPSPVTNRGMEKRPVSHSEVHIVKPGETLYSIAWKYGIDYREITRWNGIRKPYTIYPKQTLHVKPPSRKESRSLRTREPSGERDRKKVENTHRKSAKKVDDSLVNAKIRSWQWPAKGKIIRSFSVTSSGKKGIDIRGKRGQKIRAAASGKVVYSGEGLLRYGKLIIIKHNKSFLSAYAHNEKLLVKEGKWVKINQPIATMGDSGTSQVMLHFEIRKNGKPVNPVRYLP